MGELLSLQSQFAYLSSVFFGVLGLIVGSFLNVVIIREPEGERLSGRSHCRHCRHRLAWHDLVPLFSWVMLRGRCRYCRRPISRQYPLVEAATAAIFIFIGLQTLSIPLTVLALGVASLYVAILVYDLRHQLIPDAWSYGAAALTLVYGFLDSMPGEIIATLASGPAVAAPLFALSVFSGGRWMGLGDAKLALSMGWLLGYTYGFTALLLAFVIGAAISVFLLLPLPFYLSAARKVGIISLDSFGVDFTMRSEIPFGPFLIAGSCIAWALAVRGIELPLLS